jgi:hypothetical protein
MECSLRRFLLHSWSSFTLLSMMPSLLDRRGDFRFFMVCVGGTFQIWFTTSDATIRAIEYRYEPRPFGFGSQSYCHTPGNRRGNVSLSFMPNVKGTIEIEVFAALGAVDVDS